MSAPNRLGETIFTDVVQFNVAPTFPGGAIENADVAALAGLEASKLEGEYRYNYAQAPGSAVVAATLDLCIIRGATGDVIELEAAVTGAIATGADRTVTLDLQKSTGAGAFATILTSTLVLNNVNVLRTKVSASIATPGVVTGDLLRLTVAVAGAAGAQAQGLIVSVTVREDSE